MAVYNKFKIDLIYTDRFVFPKGVLSEEVIAIFNYYPEFISEREAK